MKNEGSEAKPTKNQSPDGSDQKALQDNCGHFPPQNQRNPNGQRKRSCHTLGKPTGTRSRREREAAWPERQGSIVQSIERV
jgi:hypothetical protein